MEQPRSGFRSPDSQSRVLSIYPDTKEYCIFLMTSILYYINSLKDMTTSNKKYYTAENVFIYVEVLLSLQMKYLSSCTQDHGRMIEVNIT